MPESRPLLRRFHRALVDEIRASHPEYLRSSFTVAEIYQNLVPYRTHRDIIGVEMNGDYEDALLRLLVGAGDYLVLESEPARRRIEAELRSPNPNTTIYREFAAAGVRLNPALIPSAEEAPAARGPGNRGDVALEGAPPTAPRPDAGVNPELGLFVADLFGEAGEGGSGPAGQPAGSPRVAAATPVAEVSGPAARPQPAAVGVAPVEAPGAGRVAAPAAAPSRPADPHPLAGPVVGGGEDPIRASLREENARLRRIVADQALEIQRLKERLEGR